VGKIMKWEAIEKAPKDRRILLYYPKSIFTGINITCGEWDNDSYSKKPFPHWVNDMRMLYGKVNTKLNQPSHWMEIPNINPEELK